MNPSGPPPSSSSPGNNEILKQLHRLLDSQPFKASKKCSLFLRYVVEESCEGRKEFLKERALGAALFERPVDYDTNQDPVVRNTAVQVRKRLAQYYCEPGREKELRIDLPPGAYVPEIYEPDHALPEEKTAPIILGTGQSFWRWSWKWGLAAVSLTLIVLMGHHLYQESQKPDPSSTELFWRPLLRTSGPIMICVGQGHTYKLGGDWDRLYDGSRVSSEDMIPAREIIPSFDRYLSISDVQAMTGLVQLFTQHGKNIELKGGRSTSLSDLRGRAAVLIGGFNNSWTLSLTGEQRFYFESDHANQLEIVRDRLNPRNREWEVRRDHALDQIPMDYAIVSRVFSPTLEQTIVVAAGIRGGGTQAAGEFLTNPEYLNAALKDSTPGWEKKNVQFVLATRMFSGNPGPAQVIARHFW